MNDCSLINNAAFRRSALRLALKFALGAGLVFNVGCTPPHPDEEAKVVLVTPALPPVDPATVAIGTVRAQETHDVAAQNGGRVTNLLVDIGSRVRAGQTLAVLDNRAETIALAQAGAEYRRLGASAVERRHNLARTEILFKADAVSRAEYEAAKADADAAVSAVAGAKEAVALANRNLALTVITAPVDGVVAARPIKLSDVLAAGTVAFEIDGRGGREIVTAADETTAKNLTLGAAVRFRFGETFGTARIAQIGERIVGAGTRDIRLTIESGDPPSGTIVEILLTGASLAQAKALVPTAAIARNANGGQIVFAVGKDHRLHAHAVRVLSISASGALIAGAIIPGEQIAAAGTPFLRDGIKATPIVTPR